MSPALLVAWMSLTQPAFCTTHGVCDMDATCACTVPARSAGGMFFYWDITLYRGTNITCTLSSTPSRYTWLHELSELPVGVRAQCAGDCMRYPTQIVFNTEDMADAQALMVLKYAVPPSDMPSRSGIACTPSP